MMVYRQIVFVMAIGSFFLFKSPIRDSLLYSFIEETPVPVAATATATATTPKSVRFGP